MPARALIIAIEQYPVVDPWFRTLPQTNRDAELFLAWLKASADFADIQQLPEARRKGEEAKRIFVCADETVTGRTHGTKAQDIRTALAALWAAGQDRGTEKLFVFFSGHGLLFKESDVARSTDVLVGSDFPTLMLGGAMCLRLDLLQQELLASMGPGNHFYFIDACRNSVSNADISIGDLGVRLGRSAQRDAKVFTLFSTERLSVASTGSKFTEYLVEGLKGIGRSKYAFAGPPPRLRVAWSTLLSYMKRKMPDVDGPSDSIAILWDEPLSMRSCRITVQNATPDDAFDLTPTDSLTRPLASFPFRGPATEWKQPPDDYVLSVLHPHNVVTPRGAPVDLFENCEAHFVMESPGSGGGGGTGRSGAVPEAAPPAATLRVIGPSDSTVKWIDPETGQPKEQRETALINLKPCAPYQIEVFDREGTLLGRRQVAPAAGESEMLDFRFPQSNLRSALAANFPSSTAGGWIDFSESLEGPITDRDLGVWLSIIAASRVLGPDRFEKLAKLPMLTFDDVQPDRSALYVVAGFEDTDEPFRVGYGEGRAEHRWLQPANVAGYPGLFEAKAHTAPGGLLVSLVLGNRAPFTVSSYALSNRVTVIAVMWSDGHFRIRQLMLPARGLESRLDPTVQERLPTNPLRAVKFVAQAQRLLAQRRSVTDSRRVGPEWYEVLFGKWLDPVMAIVACYELLREGKPNDTSEALSNLTKYFGDLPDTTALRRMIDPAAAIPPPPWPPLVVDGFRAFDERAFGILPPGKADYSDLWTSWRNAVPADTRLVARAGV